MGAKYNIAIGMSGVKNAVQGINQIRDAETRRRKLLKDIADAHAKVNSLQRQGAETKFARRRLEFLKAESRELDKQIGKLRMRDRVKGMMGRGIAGLAAGFGLHALASRASGAIGDAGKLARQSGTIGVGAEFLQEFQFGAEQAGMTADQAAMGMQRFARRLAQAQEGSGELLPQLEKMGISLHDAAGNARSTEDVLRDYADGVKAIQDPQAQLLAGFKAFDSEGSVLVNVLRDGAAGLDAMKQAAHDADAVIENGVVAELAAADQRLTAFGRSVKVWSANIVAKIIPIFDTLSDGFTATKGLAKISIKYIRDIIRGLMDNPLSPGDAIRRANGRFGQRADILAGSINRGIAERDAKRNVSVVKDVAIAAATAATAEVAKEAQKQGAASAAAKLASDALAQIGGFRGGTSSAQARRMDELNKNTRDSKQILQRIDRNTKGLR